MPHSSTDTQTYIKSIEFSLNQFFSVYAEQETVLAQIKNEVQEIERRIEVNNNQFLYNDQYSAQANYHYGQYLQRLQYLKDNKENLGETDAEQLQTALTRMGATEEALAVVSGAILQVAKQVLSFRFGAYNNIPSIRMTSSGVDAKDLIWNGRNNSMHWEENNASNSTRIINMFNTINTATGLNLAWNCNESTSIVDLIGWKTASDAITELSQAIQ